MKLKENKGMTLIVFTIILAVLLVIAVGVIMYLLNNRKYYTISNKYRIRGSRTEIIRRTSIEDR